MTLHPKHFVFAFAIMVAANIASTLIVRKYFSTRPTRVLTMPTVAL